MPPQKLCARPGSNGNISSRTSFSSAWRLLIEQCLKKLPHFLRKPHSQLLQPTRDPQNPSPSAEPDKLVDVKKSEPREHGRRYSLGLVDRIQAGSLKAEPVGQCASRVPLVSNFYDN
ncbi:hypothetical protein CRM22_004396 [Opisthorchis felineus]|uniref:Uncharacterized protein n=1 Tax=Opisthorchis felineus TaxID=147828 RepID=A0A4S2M2Z1_OPIFE|nr:hypothetical protein CRM22_004396 [Opisthorchis felineus]